jgi:hypothetical protein
VAAAASLSFLIYCSSSAASCANLAFSASKNTPIIISYALSASSAALKALMNSGVPSGYLVVASSNAFQAAVTASSTLVKSPSALLYSSRIAYLPAYNSAAAAASLSAC